MRGAIAIARHELAQRSIFLMAALALGILPVLVLQIVDDSQLARLTLISLLLVLCVAAFVIGMSTLGRPLHSGQLAFYFARPITGRSIAGGKLLGGALVIAGCAVLLYLPSVIANVITDSIDDSGRRIRFFNEHPHAVELALFVFFGLGLLAGVLARSWSRWFLLDFAGLTLVTVEAGMIVDRIGALRRSFDEAFFVVFNMFPPQTTDSMPPWVEDLMRVERRFDSRLDMLWIGIIIAAGVALLGAAAAAIIVGRTDRTRAHLALSTTLWSSLLVIGGVAIAIVHGGMP